MLQHILPANEGQPVFRVDVRPPDGGRKEVTNGIYAEDEVLEGIRSARQILHHENSDRVITIGGNCLVSLAPLLRPA